MTYKIHFIHHKIDWFWSMGLLDGILDFFLEFCLHHSSSNCKLICVKVSTSKKSQNRFDQAAPQFFLNVFQTVLHYDNYRNLLFLDIKTNYKENSNEKIHG